MSRIAQRHQATASRAPGLLEGSIHNKESRSERGPGGNSEGAL